MLKLLHALATRVGIRLERRAPVQPQTPSPSKPAAAAERPQTIREIARASERVAGWVGEDEIDWEEWLSGR
jgi:hypothetical protein